jgi:toxin CcdB
MAQFDLYPKPNPASRDDVPYLLDVQTDLLRHLATRIVIPLAPASTAGPPLQRLNPALSVNGAPMILRTSELAAILAKDLGSPVASLRERRDEIVAALDFLLTGV